MGKPCGPPLSSSKDKDPVRTIAPAHRHSAERDRLAQLRSSVVQAQTYALKATTQTNRNHWYLYYPEPRKSIPHGLMRVSLPCHSLKNATCYVQFSECCPPRHSSPSGWAGRSGSEYLAAHATADDADKVQTGKPTHCGWQSSPAPSFMYLCGRLLPAASSSERGCSRDIHPWEPPDQKNSLTSSWT